MSLNSTNTIGVIIGASEFPECEALEDNETFRRSANDVKRFLVDYDGLNIERGRVLDLFNSNEQAGGQVKSIIQHIGAFREAQNIVIYYCGHGDFSTNREYCLALRATSEDAKDATAFQMRFLKQIVQKHAPDKFVLLIIDACFSGAANGSFSNMTSEQNPLKANVFGQLEGELPDVYGQEDAGLKGALLLCASPSNDYAKSPKGRVHTMFSGALLEALGGDLTVKQDHLSFGWLIGRLKKIIFDQYKDEGVAPQIYYPIQDHRDVFDIPFLPNIAVRGQMGRVGIDSIQFNELTRLLRLQGLKIDEVLSALKQPGQMAPSEVARGLTRAGSMLVALLVCGIVDTLSFYIIDSAFTGASTDSFSRVRAQNAMLTVLYLNAAVAIVCLILLLARRALGPESLFGIAPKRMLPYITLLINSSVVLTLTLLLGMGIIGYY